MNEILMLLQLIIGLGILNVWLLRFGKPSVWRGGSSANMKEEFAVYGLPDWALYAVGFFKILFAVMLIAGIWLPGLILPAAMGMVILMLAAVAMHVKIGDSAKKSVPAGTLLILSLLVALLQVQVCSAGS
jgi:hypothetical protein